MKEAGAAGLSLAILSHLRGLESGRRRRHITSLSSAGAGDAQPPKRTAAVQRRARAEEAELLRHIGNALFAAYCWPRSTGSTTHAGHPAARVSD